MNNQLRGIYKMRKSLVLALVLVFAIAGATFAATPKFGGKLEVTADSPNSFTGPFAVDAAATIDISFAEEGENWGLDLALESVNLMTGANLKIKNYKATLAGEGFDVIMANNVKIGKLGGPFGYVSSADSVAADRVRVNTEFGGVDATAEFATGDQMKLFASTDVNDMTIGAAAAVDMSGTGNNDFVGYLETSFDIVDVYGEFGSVGGDTVWGVGAEATLTEQLTVDGEYESDESWAVGATFTEGVMQAKAGYDNDSVATASFTYRGSEDNQAWADLFKDDKYYLNVAPAFKVSYTTENSKITLDATAPLADNLHGKANVVVEEGKDTAITVKARAALTEKLSLSPYYVSADSAVGVDLNYKVGDGAKIGVNAESADGDQSLKATFTVEF